MKEKSSRYQNPDQGKDIQLKTRVFELCQAEYKNLYELAQAMKIPVSQIYGVHRGKYSINQKFIVRAIRLFPEYNVGDLFYFSS